MTNRMIEIFEGINERLYYLEQRMDCKDLEIGEVNKGDFYSLQYDVDRIKDDFELLLDYLGVELIEKARCIRKKK